jgi:WD40 repeat protein
MAWSPTDGRVAVSAGAGLSIFQIYEDLPPVYLHSDVDPGRIGKIAWSHSGRDLATTTYYSDDSSDPFNLVASIQIWSEDQITSNAIVREPANHFSGLGGYLAWSPSDELIANSGRDGIGIYDVETGQQTVRIFQEDILSMTWSPDGTQIAAGGLNVIWIWDVSSGELVDTITFDGVATALVWLPDLGLIHNGSANGLYQNGTFIAAPIEIMPEVTPTN